MAQALAPAPLAVVQLAAQQLWSFTPPAAHLTLRCLQGGCWVTQEGDRADHLLRAGEVMVLQPRGVVVVEALAAARLLLHPRTGRAE